MKKNSSEIPIDSFYNEGESKPGQYPFKHGIYPEMELTTQLFGIRLNVFIVFFW